MSKPALETQSGCLPARLWPKWLACPARQSWLAGLVLALALGGCGSRTAAPVTPIRPAPTLAAAFRPRELPAEPVSTAALALPGNAAATPVPSPTPAERLVAVPIYHDSLDRNWSLEQSRGMAVTADAGDTVYAGRASIALTPTVDFGQLFFTVRPDAPARYPRATTLGLSLWLYSGDDYVGVDDLALTVVGSNANPYWTANDGSVKQDKQIFFSETRLRYLGVNHDIPPQTWVELIVWLDELPYDPEYRYITGVYLKNDAGFRRTLRVDQVHLLMAQSNGN